MYNSNDVMIPGEYLFNLMTPLIWKRALKKITEAIESQRLIAWRISKANGRIHRIIRIKFITTMYLTVKLGAIELL